MELVRVDSSAVYAFGYDVDQRTLDVVFYRSGVYRYFDVPREVFDNWLSAESKGRYLHQALIGYFAYERLNPKRRLRDNTTPEATGQAASSTPTETSWPSEGVGTGTSPADEPF